MKNGYTILLSGKQVKQLASERKKTKLKDMAAKYGLSMPCMRNVLEQGRCSQRIYEKVFSQRESIAEGVVFRVRPLGSKIDEDD